MASIRKLRDQVLSGQSDQNIRFADLQRLLTRLGFLCRTNGSHHIYFCEGVEEIINIQSAKNGKAKPYQVKQVRTLMLKYSGTLPEIGE
jgi:CDGSH-type Zn-finger protein